MPEFATHRQFHMPRLLSLMLRPLPLFPLQFALQALVNSIAARHPPLHERLVAFRGHRVGIDPNDLPFAILLELRQDAIAVKVVRRLDCEPAEVGIRGSLLALIGLVNGSYDADALFFSRDITIDGDVEAAVALRNAIDDAEVDLASEVAACAAPLAFPLRHALRLAMATSAAIPIRREREWNSR